MATEELTQELERAERTIQQLKAQIADNFEQIQEPDEAPSAAAEYRKVLQTIAAGTLKKEEIIRVAKEAINHGKTQTDSGDGAGASPAPEEESGEGRPATVQEPANN